MSNINHQGYTLYQISNHPTITSMNRYVSWSGLEIQSDANFGFYIKLKYRIWAFIDDLEIPISPDCKYVALLATNETCVNSAGQIVECGTLDSVGEYDFYIGLINEPIIIQDFVVSKLTWADSEGKFNTF
jgi:hypothetical protein